MVCLCYNVNRAFLFIDRHGVFFILVRIGPTLYGVHEHFACILAEPYCECMNVVKFGVIWRIHPD